MTNNYTKIILMGTVFGFAWIGFFATTWVFMAATHELGHVSINKAFGIATTEVCIFGFDVSDPELPIYAWTETEPINKSLREQSMQTHLGYDFATSPWINENQKQSLRKLYRIE